MASQASWCCTISTHVWCLIGIAQTRLRTYWSLKNPRPDPTCCHASTGPVRSVVSIRSRPAAHQWTIISSSGFQCDLCPGEQKSWTFPHPESGKNRKIEHHPAAWPLFGKKTEWKYRFRVTVEVLYVKESAFHLFKTRWTEATAGAKVEVHTWLQRIQLCCFFFTRLMR